MNDTNSRKKLVKITEKRVTRTIKDIRLIGNLSNRSNYSYTDEDVRKIYRTLKTELDNLKSRFDAKGEPDQPVFKL